MKVALMGTRGVPARYGGFETAVEEIGSRLAGRGHAVTVYCRNPGQRMHEYRGMDLVNAPALRHRVAETLSHTAASTLHAAVRDRPDAAIVMNAGNAPFLKPLRLAGIPAAVHLDGLESRREKWRGAGAAYYRWAERAAVSWGQEVIADAQAIADHVARDYGRDCIVIPYGAAVIHPGSGRLACLGIDPGGYHLLVARFEPENHVIDAVEAFRASREARPLVVVGSAPYSGTYVDAVHAAAGGDPRIRFVGSLYDQALLDELYGHAVAYIHGHSVGGTNPSLLRAMGAGAPVLAYDVEFNREVTGDRAYFWRDPASLTAVFDGIASGSEGPSLASLSADGRARIARHYQWDAVTDQYESLLRRLAASRRR